MMGVECNYREGKKRKGRGQRWSWVQVVKGTVAVRQRGGFGFR
jgi:hypothetical protein